MSVGKRNAGAENVEHHYYVVHAKDKYATLKRIADNYPDCYAIVFCRTRMETRDVAEMFMADGYNADALHGDLSQAQRDQVMARFRSKTIANADCYRRCSPWPGRNRIESRNQLFDA